MRPLPHAPPPAPALQGPTLFQHAAFVPPGYTSLLFAHLYEPSSCPLPTTLFAGFRRFMLDAFGLAGSPADAAAAAAGGSSGDGGGGGAGGSDDGVLTVYLITRRPSRGRGRMARQIGNEPELVAALQALSGGSGGVGELAVSLLDFAGLPSECGCLVAPAGRWRTALPVVAACWGTGLVRRSSSACLHPTALPLCFACSGGAAGSGAAGRHLGWNARRRADLLGAAAAALGAGGAVATGARMTGGALPAAGPAASGLADMP